MSKTVLIVGNEQPSTLEASYAAAFKKLGWKVVFWEPNSAMHLTTRGGKLGYLFSNFVTIEPWRQKASQLLLRAVKIAQPDLLLVIATNGIRPGTLGQIKALSPHTIMYCLYPDSPHNLDNERILSFPMFNRLMTSSPAWQTSFKQLGANNATYLPFAADSLLHRPITQNPSNSLTDISFIGDWRLEREQTLEALANFNLQIWGGKRWKRVQKGSPLKKAWTGQVALGTDFAKACGQSKISLNIMDAVTWPGPNMRTFELPACRAFALAERTPAILEIFKEGQTIECFASATEARDKIAYYLKNETLRWKIAAASYDFVINQGHTYLDRSKQIANWVEVDLQRNKFNGQ
ncbi:MAG: glycosyltransferase [Anaerolineales bacterium]|nr:glycosyltransferase [Anaerolineales bacterium]